VPRAGRPRDQRRRAAVLAATRDLLARSGYPALTIGGVADRAGVARTTIYRSWPSKAALVIDAVAELMDLGPAVDTGNWAVDLRETVLQTARSLSQSVAGRTIPGLAADLTRDPELAAEFRARFAQPRKRAVVRLLQRGIAEGVVRPDLDLDLVEDLLVAPVVHRLVITGAPVDEAIILEMLDLVLRGIGDGRHSSRPGIGAVVVPGPDELGRGSAGQNSAVAPPAGREENRVPTE
jgi:AcrR family transcriptional regulator